MISFNNIKKMSASYSTNFKQFNNNKINLANHNLKNIKQPKKSLKKTKNHKKI